MAVDARVDEMDDVEYSSDVWGKVFGYGMLILLGVALLLLFLPVIVVGYVVWWALQKYGHFTKPTWTALGVATTLLLVVNWRESWVSYFTWLASLYPVGFIRAWPAALFNPLPELSVVPPVSLLVISILAASIVGALQGTWLWDTIHHWIFPKDNSLKFRENLIPDNAEKLGARIFKMPPPLSKIPGNPNSKMPCPPPGKGHGPIAYDKNMKLVDLSSNELRTNTVVFGTTGSGKTFTLGTILNMLMDNGYDGVIVDLKEDSEPGGLRDVCRAAAMARDLDYQEVCLSDEGGGPWWFNALQGMDPDETLNTIMALNKFDDQYHQALNRSMAPAAINLVYDAYAVAPDRFPTPSLFEIGRLLSNLKKEHGKYWNIIEHSGTRTADEMQERYGKAKTSDTTLLAEAASLGTKLTNLYDSEAGRQVLRPGKSPWNQDRQELDLTAPGVIYMGLSSTGRKDQAEAVAAAVIQRFSVMAARRSAGKEKKAEKFVIIDEASVVNRDQLLNLINKCRGANIRVIMATQGPDDWNTDNVRDWPRISANINVAILMRLNGDGAKVASDFIGEDSFAMLSHTIEDQELTGRASASESEVAIVPPRTFQSLGTGDFILKVGQPSRLLWAHTYPRTGELDQYTAAGRPQPFPGKTWRNEEELAQV